MKIRSLLILITLSSGLLAGCASQPSKQGTPEEPTQANDSTSWEAKMQVEKLSSGKKQRVNLDVLAQGAKKMRVEVKGTFGIVGGVGTLMNDQMTILLPRQKKAYSGAVSENSLVPILNVALDPRILASVFYDEPIPQWKCDSSHQLSSCQKDAYRVETTERTKERRKTRIEGPDFIALLVIQGNGTKVLSDDSDFTAEIPANYRIYKLP